MSKAAVWKLSVRGRAGAGCRRAELSRADGPWCAEPGPRGVRTPAPGRHHGDAGRRAEPGRHRQQRAPGVRGARQVRPAGRRRERGRGTSAQPAPPAHWPDLVDPLPDPVAAGGLRPPQGVPERGHPVAVARRQVADLRHPERDRRRDLLLPAAVPGRHRREAVQGQPVHRDGDRRRAGPPRAGRAQHRRRGPVLAGLRGLRPALGLHTAVHQRLHHPGQFAARGPAAARRGHRTGGLRRQPAAQASLLLRCGRRCRRRRRQRAQRVPLPLAARPARLLRGRQLCPREARELARAVLTPS